MSRRINTVSYQAADAGGSGAPDTFTDRIVKLIPADVVAGWLAVTSAIKAAAKVPSEQTLWIIFAFGVLFAAAWTWKQTYIKDARLPYIQTVVSTIAFCVWAYATGGASPQWPGDLYQPLTATLVLVGFSLFSGLVTTP